MLKKGSLLVLIFQVWVIIAIDSSSVVKAQSKIKTTPIAHAPEITQDLYNQKIPQKSFLTKLNSVILLTRKDATNYVLESYTSELKKIWQTPIVLAQGEEIEAFAPNANEAIILTHQKTGAGLQLISGYRIDLQTGQKKDPVKLRESPGSSRRLNVTLSPDATKLIVFQNGYNLDKLKSITSTVYDGAFTKIKDRVYDLQDLPGIASATVKITNTGDQLVALLINKGTKITVRRYSNSTTEIKGMDVQVGGAFEGKNVYVLDTKFALQPDGNLYAAAICAEQADP